jgi:hypothetical protein
MALWIESLYPKRCRAALATALHKNKNRSTLIKGWNGQRMAVSPFDGINRIRF